MLRFKPHSYASRCCLYVIVLTSFSPAVLGARLEGASSGRFLDLLLDGGWPMWPLAMCLAATVFLIIAGFMRTSREEMMPEGILGEVCALLGRGNVPEAVRCLQRHNAVITRVMLSVLARTNGRMDTRERFHLEDVAREQLENEQRVIYQTIGYLNVVSAVAPMLGLLGTVWGMMGAFRTISMGGMGNAQLMAGDISMGLITTAAGLVIAIPGLIFFWILKYRLQGQMVQVARSCNLMLDYLQGDLPFLDKLPATEGHQVGDRLSN